MSYGFTGDGTREPGRLALGTVQFGLPYGIANRGRQTAIDEIGAMLSIAAAKGIATLDTAIAYGESEKILGEVGVGGWRIVTKLPPVPDSCPDVAGWVEREIAGSLDRLRVNQLYAVLLHRPEQLLTRHGETLFSALQALKRSGVTGRIGLSTHGPEELDRLDGFPIDLVQAPMSILDRRMIDSGWARRLKDGGVELHARSAFLQGLLLMPAADRPAKFDRWRPVWHRWDAWLAERGLTPLEACLGALTPLEEVDRIVVGAIDSAQLEEIAAASACRLEDLPDWPGPLDPDLISPARWDGLG